MNVADFYGSDEREQINQKTDAQLENLRQLAEIVKADRARQLRELIIANGVQLEVIARMHAGDRLTHEEDAFEYYGYCLDGSRVKHFPISLEVEIALEAGLITEHNSGYTRDNYYYELTEEGIALALRPQ